MDLAWALDQQRGVSLPALIRRRDLPDGVKALQHANAGSTTVTGAETLTPGTIATSMHADADLPARGAAPRPVRARPGCCWPTAWASRRPAAATQPQAKAKAVIQIWMWGGPSHLDTFDPKPEAGYDYCGPLNKPIATNVHGIRIGELLPLLAKQADKYSIIRSMTHGINAHETASYMVQTGRHAGRAGWSIRASARWSRCSRATTPATSGLIPPYIVLTEPQGRFSEAGFLGARYKPFATGGDPAQARFVVEGIVAQGISDQRQQDRRELLHKLEHAGAGPDGRSAAGRLGPVARSRPTT